MGMAQEIFLRYPPNRQTAFLVVICIITTLPYKPPHMRSLIICLLLATVSFHEPAPTWSGDLSAALQKAKSEQRYVLLNFSGSDWCIPCIRMHREVFDSQAFRELADRRLILVNADFPRLKKNMPPAEQQRRNDEMAEKYNGKGVFPLTVLLDAEGRVLATWEGLYTDGPEAYCRQIERMTAAR